MTRLDYYRIARATSHIAWWTFVTTVLLVGATAAAGPVTSTARDHFDCGPRPPARMTVCLWAVSRGDYFGLSAMLPVATTAFVLLLLAAITEALIIGRLVPGLITTATPILAALIIITTLKRIDWWSDAATSARALTFIVAAIAIREVWANRLAPRLRDEAPETPAASQD
ncbi:hypothetical protein ACWCW7_07495 [Nocardia tengchongensis]